MSTVAEELRHNPRLTKSKEEFVEIMKSLGLTKPKKMGKTVLCGLTNVYGMLLVCLSIFFTSDSQFKKREYTRRRPVSFC